MISKLFATKLFEGFNIQRWNDNIRPSDFNEMDRTGLKMIIAYLLGKTEEEQGNEVDWNYIIYGGIFDLLKKIVLSDIKAPVYQKIKLNHPEEFKKLNEWVISQYEPVIDDKAFLQKFKDYILTPEDENNLSTRILKAAHRYSAYREFEVIKQLNQHSSLTAETEKEIFKDLEVYLNLKGVQQLITKQSTYDFLCIVENLRNQIRWGQSPRIPRTSVLGHSLFVAFFAMVFSRVVDACPQRLYNNFFGALFHDLPEAVTRDIISPAKSATKDLADIVGEIEKEIVAEKLYPLLTNPIKEEIHYFTNSEFANKIKLDGEVQEVERDEINLRYNSDHYSPYDGNLIKLADHIAAFLEAHQSIEYGITSKHLQSGLNGFKLLYKDSEPISGIDIRRFFSEFE